MNSVMNIMRQANDLNYIFNLLLFFMLLFENNLIYAKPPFKFEEPVQNLCSNDALQIFSNRNGPPGRRNRWQGKIRFDQWPNEDHINIEFHLSYNAKLTVNNFNGNVYQTNYGYQINSDEPTYVVRELEFRIDGQPKQNFPELIGLYLNGFDICNCKINCKMSNGWQNDMKFQSSKNKDGTDYVSMNDVKIKEKINSVCGQRKIFVRNLIKHAHSTQPGEFPWHAAIFLRDQFDSPNTDYICGGSLVQTSTIITAAHCLCENDQTVIPQRILVKLGLYNRLIISSNTKEFNVYKILTPSNFEFKSNKNDIALLKLSNTVEFSDYIQPICLWPRNEIILEYIIGKPGIVVGWGLNEESKLSNVLKTGKMPVVSSLQCLESNRNIFGTFLSENNYCAGYRNGTSVCNGDSGGSMVFEINGIFHLRGIVSLAAADKYSGHCNTKEFVLFTDTAKFLDFIENNI